MRAAAFQASARITAQATAARYYDSDSGDDEDEDLDRDIDVVLEEEEDEDSEEEEEQEEEDSEEEEEEEEEKFPRNVSRRPALRRVAASTSPSPSTSTLSSSRSISPPTYTYPLRTFATIGSAVMARQNLRDGIVQQWDPSRLNLTATDAATNGGPSRAPPTPPMNEADVRAMQKRDLEAKIMRNVEENGITRPKGYNVSFHYNRRVENMHFGRTHPMKPWRLTLTKQLVMSYGLQFAMDNFESMPASREQVETFHDPEYVDFLSKVSPQTFTQLCKAYESRIPPGYEGETVTLGPFNLSTSPGADCPVFDGMSDYLFLYTGATMEAVSNLINHQSDIAINWSGGLHHAHKSEASGFCYINDIVLAILELLKVHQRVLYIDIDVHHGDGVEEAFASSDRVMTLSFHRHGIVAEDKNVESHLFFPGTGGLTENGNPGSLGHHFALNVPIPMGIEDEQFTHLFEKITGATLDKFRPQAIVLQCGADSLGGDRLGQFNLNIRAHGECLAFVKRYNVPLLVLGGGGYTARNVARAWTHETALAVGAELSDDLPMDILPRPQAFEGKYHGEGKLYPELLGFHKNYTTPKELEAVIRHCVEELRHIENAPSVVMERLPSRAVMDEVRRQVEEEMEADRAAESSRGQQDRRRRERNPAGRGELR